MGKGILEAVHDTARGLAKAGVMNAVTLREFDALCLPTIHAYTCDEIRAIRLRNKASQVKTGRGAPARHSHAGAWEREAWPSALN